MNTMGQMGQLDGQLFQEGMAEVMGMLEEAVVINRFDSITPGDPAAGEGDTINYVQIRTTALIESLAAQEINFPNSIYATGDLKAQFRIQVYGAEGAPAPGDNQAQNRRSDLVIFRGRIYRIIGHTERQHYGGVYYWSVVLRQGQGS